MIAWLTRPLRSLREALEFGDTPRQLALGLALGMVIGLVPKGNLLCAGLCLLALSVRVNLATTMISAVVFSLVSPFIDPLTHRIGLRLLTWELIQPVLDVLYNVPLAAWTAFNNTVVIGSLSIGLGASLPVYWVSKLYFERTATSKAATRTRRAWRTITSRTYVAATQPIRIDGPLEAFKPNIAMATPADEEQLEAERLERERMDQLPREADRREADTTSRTRRVEAPHAKPAPVAPPTHHAGTNVLGTH